MDWLTPLYPEVQQVLEDAVPDYWLDLKNLLIHRLEEPLISVAILPLATCKAVNGDPKVAVHVAAALVAAEVCVRIFDDLGDQDRANQLWQKVGPARAWNFASALHILSFEILSRAPFHPTVFHRVNQLFIEAFFCIALGQERDLARRTITVESYWSMIELKTAIAYSAACGGGAIVGTDNKSWIESCGLFGHHLGLAIQVFNDFESIWDPDGQSDLEQGKITLPLIYALNLDHEYRQELEALVKNPVEDVAANAERIREILDAIDAKSFMIWAALKERDKALESIEVVPNEEGKNALKSFIMGMFGDIDQLLDSE